MNPVRTSPVAAVSVVIVAAGSLGQLFFPKRVSLPRREEPRIGGSFDVVTH